MVDFYLMHYKTKHFLFQIENIKKYVKDDDINIYVTVDSDNINDYNDMLKLASNVANVIMMPFPRLSEPPLPGWHISCSEYGLACNYIYNTYIKNSNNISVMMENDIFFIREIKISEYCKDHQICGNIRSNYNYLPDRVYHFWPGFLIFNVNIFDKDIFGLRHMMVNGHPSDSGAESYNWLVMNKDYVKNIKYFGESDNYSPFSAYKNEGRSMTINDLPDKLKINYKNDYGVVMFDDFLLHLEGIGKTFNNEKIEWLRNLI